MDHLRLSLHTQTPLVRFLRDAPDEGSARPLREYAEGEDYEYAPGGVTRMMRALLGRLTALGRVRHADWSSLATQGPSRLRLSDRVALHHVRLPPDRVAEYGAAKSALWDAVHLGADAPRVRNTPAATIRAGLSSLSMAMGRRAAELHRREPFDLFYVHDFQLLPLASYLPERVPRLFRWHIPVPESFPHQAYVVDRLNRYDAVIVSTRGYAERLRRLGVTVPVHARYPYLDERRHRVVTAEDLDAFDARWGLAPDEPAFILVARLDPMKSQDVAIRALARIRDAAPKAKLLLVGGGGFSGGKRGGLGLAHVGEWREHLHALARELRVEDRVVFTGNVPDDELEIAYQRARAVLLPSRLEGFGLAAIEGWLHGRPVLVSRGAGVAELVRDGHNGYSFAPGDDAGLADAMLRLAHEPDAAQRMGHAGRAAARACHLAPGTDAVWHILHGVASEAGTRSRGR